MTTTYIIGVTKTPSSESQSLIACGEDEILFSTAEDTLPEFVAAPFSSTGSGNQYNANLTNTSPPAGTLGERIESVVGQGSAVSVTNDTPTDITNISLTAGIWDVTGIVGVEGVLVGSTVSGSISTESETLGTPGDNLVQIGLLGLTASQMVTIPSYRIELAETTTIYLVASAEFSLGSVDGYGRLSATRVG